MLVESLKEFFEKIGKKKAVIGLSGGVDSAVCLALTVKAIGSENVTAIFMPEIGLSKSEDDARDLAKELKVEFLVVPINSFLIDNFPWKRNNIAKMNIKPRIRMIILYDFANSNDAIVIGTSNKSEIYLGYGTKHGDFASDVLPIGDLLKTEVYSLASELGIPKSIINKKPTAELELNQFDETEIGMGYEEIDNNIKKFLNGENIDEKILKRIKDNEHKRKIPLIMKK